MSLYLGENCISAGGSSIFRNCNIGEIIQSAIPLNDAGLHLLDGALISGSGSYADFVTYIAGLVSTYPDLFEKEANWQTSVTTYGVCGKFVYDSVNNTVRLPKITGFIEGTTDLTALGDLVEAGLPNITGTLRFSQKGFPLSDAASASGALYKISESTNGYFSNDSDSVTRFSTIGFSASNSNPIYGRSSTVRPQSIKVLYYIVIATSAKTDIQVDIDEIATDLNGKADIDFTNCNYIPMRSDVVHIVETYVNGTSWYRVYSDGWCEQGGKLVRTITNGGEAKISLIKAYVNTSYNIQVSGIHISGKWGYSSIGTGAITVNSFYVFAAGNSSPDGTQATYWETGGYIS